MPLRLPLLLSLLLALPAAAAPVDEAANLEARLKETAEASPAGAQLMLDLIDLYWKDGQVFGLIRTATTFSRSQPEHPQRAAVMLKLLEGYAATARHEDVITTSRQFLDLFPADSLANEVRDRFATALERTGRSTPAAGERAAIWKNGGPTDQGVRALRLWTGADNADAFKQASALAAAMTAKLPAETTLTEVGFQGMEAARRSEQWAEGLQIAKTLASRKAPMNETTRRDLAQRTGQFESALGQHENAIQSFKQALVPGNDEIHRSLIHAMINAKKAPAEIEAEARRYLAAFPRRDDRCEPLARAAHAANEAGDKGRAIAIAEDVLQQDVTSHDIPRAYLDWCGDDQQRAVSGLREAIARNPSGAPKLRAILALGVYRDRLKDNSKARETAREFLAKSPSQDDWSDQVIKFLYDSAPGPEAFQQDLDAVVASARAFPHLAGFQDRVWNPGPAEKERNRVWQNAKRDYQNHNTTKLWRQTREDGGKSGQACQALLQQNPPAELRLHLLARLAYVYRHHLGGKSKEVSGKHYETLCQAAPKDLDAAARWLEAATLADRDQQLAAARHLLSIAPADTHPDTWIRLCELKDKDLIRKALPWITASSQQSPNPLNGSARIGDIMHELGMKDEAAAWWKSRMDLNPNDWEAVSCALRLANTMEPAAATAFLRDRSEDDTHFHGAYAGEIANLAFRSNDLAAMEKILSATRARADRAPFSPSGLGEWPARGWLEAARNATDWPAERKTLLYRLLQDLRLGRLSAEAGLELVPAEPRTLDRLLRTQRLILLADPHYESWNRIFPHAQAAFAREDYSLAAAILNGLLNSIRSVGEAETDAARTLLRNAYAKMGGLSADIPADSPIAPLLQIILHLRLGEDELAEQAYYKNQGLFDTHRAELPVELLLFGAETHIAQGAAGDHERAEDILRGWLLKNGESDKVDIRDKARVQLLLARNYQRASQYDIARAEFTTVLNIFKDQPEAIEARFGIGETYMAQKVYDQATELFTDLTENPVPAIAIRARFLLGVLALRQDNNEEARQIFLSVLENTPAAELANETLYNLAEVYGIEQRYLTQLETLRTVGRLGQESSVWHTPGTALSVVVQDPDLGISRGDTRIPVVVRTEPGNDEEQSFLASGGAGKGIFLTEVPTTLGEAKAGDGVLQVTGGDTIIVDYPEEFKKQFQFEFLSSTRLRIASDGDLQVASSEIIDTDDESFTETLQKEVGEEQEDQPRAATRPKDQVKPGNLVYVQVKDGDRDRTTDPDKVPIKLTSSGGDTVQVMIDEESAHGGVFHGTVRTGELPAGAKASDSALDHSPLMAIDHDPATAWRSEPDGAAPKSLTVDMKELRPVETITLSSPQAEEEAPVRMNIRGSHDGRFWFTLARFPTPAPAKPLTFTDPGMQLRLYRVPADTVRETYSWDEIADLVAKIEPSETKLVETLAWESAEADQDACFLLWSGPFVQERDGALRIEVAGRTTAVLFDGRLELPVGEGGRSVDLFASRGVHQLTVFSIATPAAKAAGATRARENTSSAAVSLRPFTAADFDPAAVPGLPEIKPAPLPEIKHGENRWTLAMPSRELRHIEFEILEYRGEAVAVGNVEVTGGGATHLPPAANVLELAGNDILELAPGDTVAVSYIDELTAGGRQTNKLLTQSLTATYYNGSIIPIAYDFARGGGGTVSGTRKELLRIEPGGRIVAEVADFDLDTGLGNDSVEVEVQVNGEPPVTCLAKESGSSTGIFLAEIETAAAPAEGKLVVKQGDKVYLRYRDTQNIFPGHSSFRETVVLLNEPTPARIQIVDSETPVAGQPRFLPVEGSPPPGHVAKVEFRLPLTVEVIDPDQARDSRSTVLVDLATSQGTKVQVECVLSRSFAPASESLDDFRNPALLEGRFVGQVPLVLGGPDSAPAVPADGTLVKGGLGRVILPVDDSPEALLDDGSEKGPVGLPVLNTLGTGTFTARYTDESNPAGLPKPMEANAALFSAATLAITDEEYLEPAEIAHVGKKIYLLLSEPDRDTSGERDKALVRLVTTSGEDETLELEETLSHSGIFSGSFPLAAIRKPVPGNFAGSVECFFGDQITAGYLDNVAQTPDGEPVIERILPVAVGTDGILAAFSKAFKDENLAIQTQFHIAESHFELFKSHRKLKQDEEAAADLDSGRRVLRELQEDYPNPKYAPRVAYLLGQFAQEMRDWNEAIAAYGSITRNHPEHSLAPDAQYKLGQCYEEAGELDSALEAYVTLAGTYPKSPLVANVMLRINEHFYTKEDFAVAAAVGAKFLERFPNHEWTPKMSFRIGQCFYKLEEFQKAGLAFDEFVKRFPDQELTPQGLFWAGESYRMGKDIPNAFRRYNRCRWDFPESEAAKYSRGRLALPELLEQFDREANLNE